MRIKTNPTPLEVKNKRRIETEKAMADLGVQKKRLYFLNLTEGDGKVRQNEESTKKQIKEITESEKPNLIYFHYPDAQPDHQILAKITLEVLRESFLRLNAYQFFIWTKELAKGRPEVDDSRIVDVPLNALRVDISNELIAKRNTLFRMNSQVNVWPYPDWQIQTSPILDKKFLDYFLRGEEIFLKVKN